MSAAQAWVLLFLILGVVSMAWGIYYSHAKKQEKLDKMMQEAKFASKRKFKNNRPPRFNSRKRW